MNASSARQQAPAKPAVQTRKAGATVTVACKVQNGVVLQLCQKAAYTEDTPAGPRERVRYDKVGKRITVRGPSYPMVAPPGFHGRPQVVGGYALTPGIDADFFEEWMRQNKLNPIVANHMIFAHGSRSDAVSEAREKAGLRSGFEPIDPDGNDPRMPKPLRAGLTGIGTADEMAERSPLIDDGSDED